MHSSFLVIALAGLVAAKTNIAGCVSSKTQDPYGAASLLWYVPETGEICELLDCGGGRAPPKTTVPGCGAYSGTATYSPRFLDLAASTTVASTSASAAPQSSAPITSTSAASVSEPSTTLISSQISSGLASEGPISSGSASAVPSPSTTLLSGVPSSSTTGSGSTPAQTTGVTPAPSAPGTTVAAGGSTNTTSPAGGVSATPNAASSHVIHGLVGAVAAGFAFLL